MLTQMVGGRVYDYSHQVGGREMLGDVALALGEGDVVYCVTRAAYLVTVLRLSIGATPGDEKIVGQFGERGDGDGGLVWPAGIAVDSDYNVYVTDEWLNRVTVFAQDGAYLGHWGEAGDGAGQLRGPSGIDVDANGDLYVVDSLNHRVQKFGPSGDYLMEFGSYGSGRGELDKPWGLTLDDGGNVYVADHKNHRVQKFGPSGDHLMEFGSYGSGRGELNRPSGVAVDPDGDVYVSDWGNSRVQVFAPDGEFLTSLIGDAQTPSKWFQETIDANDDVAKARRLVDTLEPEWRLALPCDLVFDTDRSRVIIADTQRRRVQIYNKLRGYIEPQVNL